MKKIYLLFCTSLSLLLGGITACDDGSLSHDDVYIPDPIEISDEDDGYSSEPTTESVIRVKLGEGHEHQLVDGFGCNFGWAEAVYQCTQRDQILDDLYGDAGLRFNIYRGEVSASTVDANDNFNFFENDNYHQAADSPEVEAMYNEVWNGERGGRQKQYAQLWIIDRLCKKKIKDIYYFFSVWSPPVQWKSFEKDEEASLGNGSFNYNDGNGYGKKHAQWLTSFVKTYNEKFGINIYGISGWNEPDHAMGGWSGCEWSYQDMANFVHKDLRTELDAQGLTDTKIIYGELAWWDPSITWIKNSLQYEPELANDKIIAAGHGYSTVAANIKPMSAAEEKGIPVWLTETCDDKSRDETWTDAMKWALNYQTYMTKANTSAIVWWAGARQCSTTGENLIQTVGWPISRSYYRVNRYYSIGQFSRYIPRNSRRVDVETVSTSANRIPKDLTASAYIKDDTYTIVLVNSSKTRSVDALLEIDGHEFESMVSYTSNASVKWLRKKLNPSMSGKRSVTIPKFSVVTITGRFSEKGSQTVTVE